MITVMGLELTSMNMVIYVAPTTTGTKEGLEKIVGPAGKWFKAAFAGKQPNAIEVSLLLQQDQDLC